MNDVVAVNISPFTAEDEVQEHQGKFWELNVAYPLMTRAQASPIIASLASLNGRRGTFFHGDPLGATPLGTVQAGTPLVRGAGQTGKVLSTKGWTPNAVNVLLKGDYIQLGTGSGAKLHVVLIDVTADGTGLVDFDIWPSLRPSPVDESVIIINNCVGVFRLTSNSREWSESIGDFYNISFSARESV